MLLAKLVCLFLCVSAFLSIESRNRINFRVISGKYVKLQTKSFQNLFVSYIIVNRLLQTR